MRVLMILLGMALAMAPAFARAAEGGVSVDGVWCQVSTERAGTAYVYLTMSLIGKPTERLIGAVTPIAKRVDILTLQRRHGALELLPGPGIPLDPHEPTVLQPLEHHLILRGVLRRLKHGDTFPLTLSFEGAPSQEVTARVMSHAPADGMPKLPKGVKLD